MGPSIRLLSESNPKREFCIEAKIVVTHYDHINHFLCISNFIMTLYDSNVFKKNWMIGLRHIL